MLTVIISLVLSAVLVPFLWVLAQSFVRTVGQLQIIAPEDLSDLEEILLQARRGTDTLLITDRLTDEDCCTVYRIALQVRSLYVTTGEQMDQVVRDLLHLQKEPSCSILEEVEKEQ